MERPALFRAQASRGKHACLNAAGLPKWDLPWCEELVLDRIAEYQRQGVSLHYNEIDVRDRSLMYFATKYYGSWDGALRRFGVDPEHVRHVSLRGTVKYPNPASVIAAIRERHQRNLPLNTSALMAPAHSPLSRNEALLKQAIAFFGSLDQAIKEAGLAPQRLRRRSVYLWPEAVLEAIRRRYREGMPLHAAALTAGPREHQDMILYRQGRELFGSWNRAIAEAGLPPQCVRVWRRFSTPESVLQEIERRKQSGLSLTAHRMRKGADVALVKCAVRYFGSWLKALEASRTVSDSLSHVPARNPRHDLQTREPQTST